MPNLATGLFRDAEGTVVLVVQNSVAPSNDEWESYLANIRLCLAVPQASGLAFTDGGTPNALQRGRVNEVLGSRRPASAVVSNSFAIRSVITALRWFNPNTAAFSAGNVTDALRFAQVESHRFEALWLAVLELDRLLTPRSRIVAEAAQALRKVG